MLQIMSIFWVVSLDWMGLMYLWTGMWKRCHIFGKSNWQKWMNMSLKGYHWRTWYMLDLEFWNLAWVGFSDSLTLWHARTFIQNLTCIFLLLRIGKKLSTQQTAVKLALYNAKSQVRFFLNLFITLSGWFFLLFSHHNNPPEKFIFMCLSILHNHRQ